jgi:hypothetical protein
LGNLAKGADCSGTGKSPDAFGSCRGMSLGVTGMQPIVMLWLALIGQGLPAAPPAQTKGDGAAVPEKSAYYSFVDRDFIFTVEMVGPGVALLNFVSMLDEERVLSAKLVRLTLENRKTPAIAFLVDTGDPKEPIAVPSITMRPRSSFGVRIKGDYGSEKEISGVTLRVGTEDLKLVPQTSLEFENLVIKVNRINLNSPNFRDDWQAVKLEVLGSRMPAPRR